MATCRIHITGASGSGTTTLGRTLGTLLAIPHHDSDDYFWEPTEPPYTTKRDEAERLHLMRRLFVPRAGWVLSGSLVGWGDPLIASFDLVVFLHAATDIRIDRLRRREAARRAPRGAAPPRPRVPPDWMRPGQMTSRRTLEPFCPQPAAARTGSMRSARVSASVSS